MFMIRPISRTIGALVTGIDLTRTLADVEIDDLRAELLDSKVLCFRDQDISPEQLIRFGRRFGELEVHPVESQVRDYPEVFELLRDGSDPGSENVWHSDVSWSERPSSGTILHFKQVPLLGGNTLWVDMEAAYDGLAPEIKDKVEGRVAVHDFHDFQVVMASRGATTDEIRDLRRAGLQCEHPVIRTHPETGRRCIYVNPAFTRHIVDMDPIESSQLLQHLYRQASIPEYQVRFKWSANSIAFWDNRSTQHYGASDFYPHTRRAYGVTLAGDRPFYDATKAPTDDEASPFRGRLLSDARVRS